jgi:putative flavoprotein involved in K+ transport
MTPQPAEHRLDTVVVGGGQAGLAMGYFLAAQHRDFMILEAAGRVGDTWRNRWDSLRLFTPAFHSGLPGMPFPAPGHSFPTKDQTAAYLEAYASRFQLPLRLGRRVECLARHGGGYLLRAGDERYTADQVVVATGPYHHPNVPGFAAGLDPMIAQLHSSGYRNPGQLPPGDVLVVGAGNSGAEIAVELAATRRTYLSGPDVAHAPIWLIHNRVSLWLADHLLTVDTSLGRRMRDTRRRQGDPLVRLKPADIPATGVQRVPRVDGVADGTPRLADGRLLEVAVVVWATGYRPDFGWIDLPVFDDAGNPSHHRGVVAAAPGLYFLGLPFQHTPTSDHVGGVGRDAHHIAQHLAAQSRRPAGPAASTPSGAGSGPACRTRFGRAPPTTPPRPSGSRAGGRSATLDAPRPDRRGARDAPAPGARPRHGKRAAGLMAGWLGLLQTPSGPTKRAPSTTSGPAQPIGRSAVVQRWW